MSRDNPSRPDRSRCVPALLTSLSVLIATALLFGGPVGEATFAVLAVLLPVGLMALGTRRVRSMRPILVALGLVLTSSALAVWLMPTDTPAGSYRLGLPAAAWVALIGLGLIPFVIVVLGYGLTFEKNKGSNDPAAGPHDG